MLNNEERAGNAFHAITEYGRCANGRYIEDLDTVEAIVGLLTDLRHLCDKENIDFDQCLENSAIRHHEDANEELAETVLSAAENLLLSFDDGNADQRRLAECVQRLKSAVQCHKIRHEATEIGAPRLNHPV